MKRFFSKKAAWYTNDRPNMLAPGIRGRGNVYDDIMGTFENKGVKTEEESEKLWTKDKKNNKVKNKRRKIKKKKKE